MFIPKNVQIRELLPHNFPVKFIQGGHSNNEIYQIQEKMRIMKQSTNKEEPPA